MKDRCCGERDGGGLQERGKTDRVRKTGRARRDMARRGNKDRKEKL